MDELHLPRDGDIFKCLDSVPNQIVPHYIEELGSAHSTYKTRGTGGGNPEN